MGCQLSRESVNNGVATNQCDLRLQTSDGDLSLVTTSIAQDSEWGTNDYIEYQPGAAGSKIVLAAPHGGDLEPANIPTRDAGCIVDLGCVYSHACEDKDESNCRVATVKDMYTLELTIALADEISRISGLRPHVILNHLHRRKLDANRDREEATFDEPDAVTAWDEFHAFIDRAKASVGTGLFIDVHGHGHPEPWIELGYLFTGLNLDLDEIDPTRSSIRHLSTQVNVTFEELLRGAQSFGGDCENEGYDAVPGPTFPGPNGGNYFSGGYNTRRHGSRDGGTIDAIQIESPRFLRDIWPVYAEGLGQALVNFVQRYYP
ncbi:unnamed protein product [Owenia fusiformis]|uniref:Uncharacterized protein n=1 Tax=Owenia fusiformis TaxID=6347 RepID=A0A8J1TD03_OWEFU|nr:unnamed protein product [Owenia fusiformis]